VFVFVVCACMCVSVRVVCVYVCVRVRVRVRVCVYTFTHRKCGIDRCIYLKMLFCRALLQKRPITLRSLLIRIFIERQRYNTL